MVAFRSRSAVKDDTDARTSNPLLTDVEDAVASCRSSHAAPVANRSNPLVLDVGFSVRLLVLASQLLPNVKLSDISDTSIRQATFPMGTSAPVDGNWPSMVQKTAAPQLKCGSDFSTVVLPSAVAVRSRLCR